ncbi:hypothetical protein NOV18_29835 (plasmid) [Pseudomonas asiatica]|uniref:Lipoprotein n=1 Tax=Pseudomonas asiatica TaxID=2219225 RepID=A0AAJ5HYK5_9PSED|nr:hypothetical protein [Pseudomonas asiatica]UUC21919.1 hypothetical protein NOV18_29835 [Pseudomonas asiatica]
MKGKMMLLACLLVSACGNGEVENNAAGVASTGQVDGHPDWKMPNSTVYEIVNSPNKKATYGYEFRAKRTKDWESEGWTVWVASNTYSDAKAQLNNAGQAEQSHVRARREGRAMWDLKLLLKNAGLPVSINYLSYGQMPMSTVRTAQRDHGVGMTFFGDECGTGFRECVDHYYYSPALRLKERGKVSFKEWLAPYSYFPDNEWGQINQRTMLAQGFGADESSAFYDWWPTMVFLVNPDNEVVRAWLPQTGNAATPHTILRAVVEEMDVDPKTVSLTGARPAQYTTFPNHAYFGTSMEDKAVQDIAKILEDISG